MSNTCRADKLEAEQLKDVQEGQSDPQKVSASETAVSKDPSETKVTTCCLLMCGSLACITTWDQSMFSLAFALIEYVWFIPITVPAILTIAAQNLLTFQSLDSDKCIE